MILILCFIDMFADQMNTTHDFLIKIKLKYDNDEPHEYCYYVTNVSP